MEPKEKETKVVGKFVIFPNKIRGKGSFGITTLARFKNDNIQKLACKTMNKSKL